MRPLKRRPVNKYKAAKKFRRQSARTKRPNMLPVSRGGIRF